MSCRVFLDALRRWKCLTRPPEIQSREGKLRTCGSHRCVGGVVEIQTGLPVAVALKFTVHGVQSFIKGHRKSGVIPIEHSRDMTHRISTLTSPFLPVSAIGEELSTFSHVIVGD